MRNVIKLAIFAACFVFAAGFPPTVGRIVFADSAAPVAVDASLTPVDAGIAAAPGSASVTVITATTLPVDKLHDPAANPLAAISDVEALKSQGWGLLLVGLLVQLGRIVRDTAPELEDEPGPVGRAAMWLATGRRAVLIAGAIGVASAAFNALALGGSWVAPALAAIGAALAATHATKQPKQPAPNALA